MAAPEGFGAALAVMTMNAWSSSPLRRYGIDHAMVAPATAGDDRRGVA
jgi:hypothetical protein